MDVRERLRGRKFFVVVVVVLSEQFETDPVPDVYTIQVSQQFYLQ